MTPRPGLRSPRALTIRQRKWVFSIVVLCILAVTDYVAYPYGRWDGGRSGNRGENGLWLRYTWYFGQHPPLELAPLAQRLRQAQVRYAYFHVRDIRADGTLRFRHPRSAKQVTDALHRQAPDVRVIAWVYAGNAQGLGHVDLTKPAVRRAMVQQAVWLVGDCGFDGVQWDYEICPDGDAGFLALLRETRAALGPAHLLCAATPLWLPGPLRHWGWSDAYYSRVAAQCDQIAVMCYDSAVYSPRGYAALVRHQVVHVTQDAARGNPRCRVIIGVPTYAKGGLSHDPHTETMAHALLGVRQGMADPRTNLSVFAGVAPFADYTTQPDEWQSYQRLWLSTR